MKRSVSGALFGASLVAIIGGACATQLTQRFPHSVHLEGIKCGGPGQPACLSCPSCHRTTGSGIQPVAQVCIKCHDKETDVAKKQLPNAPSFAPRPDAYAITFDHDRHLSMTKIGGQCVKCHQGVSSTPGRSMFPPMSNCLNCHEHQEQFAQNDCRACHATNEVHTLKPVTFLPHDQRWPKRHGEFVRDNPAACTVCHAQTYCDTCHDTAQSLRPELRNPDAIGREFVHRFDFLSRHGIEARSQPGQCNSCHTRTECDACHTRSGVSAGAEFGRNPHPTNWASGSGAAANLHGREARRDIASCAACHDQGPVTNCIRCHKVGGFGGSPHPPGWRTTQAPDSSSCTACHGGGL